MSKHFEEVKLVFTADVVFDPDDESFTFYDDMLYDIMGVLDLYKILYKNADIRLEGFICDDNSST